MEFKTIAQDVAEAKTMNVVCATDKNFLCPAYVTIWSVIKNHPGIKVCFYLLITNDITQAELAKLSSFVESSGNSIIYIKDEGLYDDSDFEFSQKFTKVTFFRLMVHKYLPETVDRVLYLDVDIVVDKNIYDDFYMTDFKGNYLVVASHSPDPAPLNALTSATINLQTAAKGSYFNAGVLLMNIELFRKNIDMNSYKAVFEECAQKGIKIFYDQGLLNYMFGDKCIYVSSMDYNYRQNIPIEHANKLDKNRIYKQAIIHYTGYRQYYKPWDLYFDKDEVAQFGKVPFKDNYFYVSDETERLSAIWWDYASQTPVYEHLKYELNIKKGWFKRILMPLILNHNKMMQENEKNRETIKRLQKRCQLLNSFAVEVDSLQHIQSVFNSLLDNHYENIIEILKSESNLDSYLQLLQAIQSNFLIIMAVKDTPGRKFTQNQLDAIKKLGFSNFRAEAHVMYIGVSSSSVIKCNIVGEKVNSPVMYSEKDSDIELNITSMAWKYGDKAEISINGTDYSVNMRGINFVVYDKKQKGIIDSIAFDCYDENIVVRRKY